MYYVCGDTLKGDDYMMKLVNNYSDKVQYYGNMKPKFREYYNDDLEEGISLLHHFERVAGKYGRTEMKDLITERLNGFLGSYYTE